MPTTPFKSAQLAFQELEEKFNILNGAENKAYFREQLGADEDSFFDDYQDLVDFFGGAENNDNTVLDPKLLKVLELDSKASQIIKRIFAIAEEAHRSMPTPSPSTPSRVARSKTPSPSATHPVSRGGGAIPPISREDSQGEERAPDTSWTDGDVGYAIRWLEGSGSDLNRGTARELREFYDRKGHEAQGDNEKKSAERFKSIIQIARIMGGAESGTGAHLSLPRAAQEKICAAHSNMDPTLVSKFVDITVAESHERVKRRLRAEKGLTARDKKLPSIICMNGPPGIGKSSIAHGLAQGLETKLYTFDCNAKTGRGPIFGYEKTYASPTHGFYMDAILKTGRRNPLILLDEVPRLGDEKAKDAMMVITDPGVTRIRDDFLGIEIPKDAVFIATSNDMSRLDPALRDRFVTEELHGYGEDEKIDIVKNKLLKRELEGTFLDEELELLDLSGIAAAVDFLVKEYSFTEGVREHVMNMRALNSKLVGMFVDALKAKYIREGLDQEKAEEKALEVHTKVTEYQVICEQIASKGSTPKLEEMRSQALVDIKGYGIDRILKFDRDLIQKALGSPKARAEQVQEEMGRDIEAKLKARIDELERRIAQEKERGHNTDDLERELKLLREEMSRGRDHTSRASEPASLKRARPEEQERAHESGRPRARVRQDEGSPAIDCHFRGGLKSSRAYSSAPAIMSFELSELVAKRMRFASDSSGHPEIVGMSGAPKSRSLDDSWSDIAGNTARFLEQANDDDLGDGDWTENAYGVYEGWKVTGKDDTKFTSVYSKDGGHVAKVDYTKQDGAVKARASLDGFADPEVADKAIAQMLEVATRVYLETGKDKVNLNGLEDRPDLAVKFMEAAALLAQKDIKLKIVFDQPTVAAVMRNTESSNRLKTISEIEPSGAGIVKQSVGYEEEDPKHKVSHSSGGMSRRQ